uniref:hypothetical protein n=1 Tax=Clostridium sp. NkU-1 TaxID=1095009 RepID=UPI000ABB0133
MEQCMNNYRMIVLSSLEKVFPHEEPVFSPECCRFSGLYGETLSFQSACCFKGLRKETLKLRVSSALKDSIRVRQVVNVPPLTLPMKNVTAII